MIQAAYIKFVQQFDLLRRQLRLFAGTSKLSHTACVYTQNTYTQCFYKWQVFTHTHSKLFKQRSLLHTEKLLHTTSSYTENLLHTASFHTQQAFTHRTLTHSAFTHGKRLLTQKLLHRDAFTHREAFTHSKLLHKIFYTQQTFPEKSFYTEKRSCT